MKLHFLFFVYWLLAIAAEDELPKSSSDEQNPQNPDGKATGPTKGKVIGNIFRTVMEIFPLSTGTEYESALDVLHCSHCILRKSAETEFCHKFCVTNVNRSKIILAGPSSDVVHCDVCLFAAANSPPGVSCAQVCSAGQLGRILTRLLNDSSQNLRVASLNNGCVNTKSSNETAELNTEIPQTRVDQAAPSKNTTNSTVNTLLPIV